MLRYAYNLRLSGFITDAFNLKLKSFFLYLLHQTNLSFLTSNLSTLNGVIYIIIYYSVMKILQKD